MGSLCAISAPNSTKRSSITGECCSIGDQITIERIEALIADLKTQKATLHPEQKA
jgi:hypothetical protein